MTTLTNKDALPKVENKSTGIKSSIIELAEILSLWGVTAGVILLTSFMWVN